MNRYLLAGALIVRRDAGDRRAAVNAVPPYLTAEGFVLIDRRENAERRAVPAVRSQLESSLKA